MSSFEEIQRRAADSIIGVYARFPVAFTHGVGTALYATDGRRYLDFAGGIAVNSLGHAHPRVAQTLAEQSQKLIHISNLYYNEPQVLLAERLKKLFGPGKCFFSNSGVEANEGLFKLARRYGQETGRYEVITAVNSFHGRTLGGIAATGQEKIKAGFLPLVDGFKHVPFNNLDAMREAISEKTAAILIEGIQGEGGITPATPEYLLGLRKLCDERGVLLFVDAVQCGHFRTGRFQSYERLLEGRAEAFTPDAVSYAKSLGAGFPIGGIWIRDRYTELLTPGSHGTTFGGSPLACAVANTVLDVIEEERLVENVRAKGEMLAAALKELQSEFPSLLHEVRGYGCILGLELIESELFQHETLTPAQVVINALLKNGMLLVPSGKKVLRLLPPYILQERDIEEAVQILRSTLRTFK